MNKNKRIVRICGILLGLALSAASCAIGGSTGSSGMYSLSYEANSGDGIMEKSLFPAGGPGTLRKNTFTRDGYDFAGWALTKDGMAEYEDEDAFTNPGTREGPVILYAVWDKSWILTDTASWDAAVAAVANGADNKKYIFTVDGNVGVPGSPNTTYTFGGRTGITVALRGTGKLYLTSRGGIFNVNDSQTLIIGLPGDENSKPTLEGLRISQNGASQNNEWAVVIIHGTLVLNNGAIRGNYADGGGGGVRLDSGSFIMNGGTISGNFASVGGGVRLDSGSFTMNGGTIRGNTASSNAGGVYAMSGCSFTMNGGTISGNTASYNAGGVYGYNSSFTMTGGTISGNTASSYNAGGVYGYNSRFTMTGGTISGNRASQDGGGVYAISSSFDMTGGTISGNTASQNGGGVYVENGSFTKSGGTIWGYGSPANTDWNEAGSVSNSGHAVYCKAPTGSYYRDITLTRSDNIRTSELPETGKGYNWIKLP